MVCGQPLVIKVFRSYRDTTRGGSNPLYRTIFIYEVYPKDAVVVERQTRHFEGVVGEIPCGFKSHRPHQI